MGNYPLDRIVVTRKEFCVTLDDADNSSLWVHPGDIAVVVAGPKQERWMRVQHPDGRCSGHWYFPTKSSSTWKFIAFDDLSPEQRLAATKLLLLRGGVGA